MRLDKFISAATGLSRREAERVVRQGDIEVEGVGCKKTATQVTAEMNVLWQGRRLSLIGNRYLMLHKPAGVVSSNDDPAHPSVFSLIDEPRVDKMHCVGRLDVDTTGLLLITDDGQWSHRITSPKRKCSKTYRATLADPVSENAADLFANGVMLRGEETATQPAVLEVLSETDVRLTITEGRYHQVKRMFAATGNKVVSLHRESVGALQLDESLQPGEYRSLTEDEIALFS